MIKVLLLKWEEAALFCTVLYRMYCMFAEKNSWKIEILNFNKTGISGIKEISFCVNDRGAYSKFKFESGVHRVQTVPETETQGRVHTSTLRLQFYPKPKRLKFKFKKNKYITYSFKLKILISLFISDLALFVDNILNNLFLLDLKISEFYYYNNSSVKFVKMSENIFNASKKIE